MRDIMGLMKKAQEMQAKMADVQTELDATEVTGVSGGGAVSVTMSAKGELKQVDIDKDLLKPEEKDILQDLIVAAHADARRKAESIAQEKMQAATAGLPLPPGMKLF
jgi:DNA-binding YbaB/EbfC family protein